MSLLRLKAERPEIVLSQVDRRGNIAFFNEIIYELTRGMEIKKESQAETGLGRHASL